ncbi:hypothetical protein PO073_24680 [Bacteroides thetaiotaomicron]|jgi:hypothetical protein|uniref:hypothetical protein n=1 Tax=Bacteroides thetaiotaomicron TaxID=818 RepID=UPI00189C9002|nr:hypothetical protein [Bacteroides thetaiotaomicron]MDC2175184.1 hypothetical protein [Bacteroides thetaiotaomicron]MDC2190821.1 hypothetical protein [Bacteroides thetaiotaomicron]
MATTAEILNREELLKPCIYLYKEGVFWKAYQYSAYRVVQRHASFKLKKKFVKAVSCEIVSLGFPDTTLERMFDKQEIETINEKMISIPCGELDKQAYKEWFDNLPLLGRLVDSCLPGTDELRIRTISTGENILRKIREFRIEDATPLSCMEFVVSMRKELIG